MAVEMAPRFAGVEVGVEGVCAVVGGIEMGGDGVGGVGGVGRECEEGAAPDAAEAVLCGGWGGRLGCDGKGR